MKEIKPIVLKDNETGEAKYTLEFTRGTAAFAIEQGFRPSEFLDRLPEMLPILWYSAFRKNHRNVSRAETDKILHDLHGLKAEEIKHLGDLFGAARESALVEVVNTDEDDERKNAPLTVEL